MNDKSSFNSDKNPQALDAGAQMFANHLRKNLLETGQSLDNSPGLLIFPTIIDNSNCIPTLANVFK